MTRTLKETRMLEALEKIAAHTMIKRAAGQTWCIRCNVESARLPFPHREDCPVLIASNACADIREIDERDAREGRR